MFDYASSIAVADKLANRMGAKFVTDRLERFNESEFNKDIERLGGRALKQRADIDAGIPDRLCWMPCAGRIIWFWVEWKRKGKEPMPHQLAYHKKLRDAGHTVYVFDCNNQAREVLRGYAL